MRLLSSAEAEFATRLRELSVETFTLFRLFRSARLSFFPLPPDVKYLDIQTKP